MALFDHKEYELSKGKGKLSIDQKGLETYRQLEWVRLKSYYIIRQNILAFYKPMEKDSKMKLIEADEKADSEDLLEKMAVLTSGITGTTQESLEHSAEVAKNTNEQILNTEEVYRFVEGRVMDQQQNPVQANISIKEFQSSPLTQANENGKYYLCLQPGKYELTVAMKSGYEEAEVEIKIPDWKTEEYRISPIVLKMNEKGVNLQKYQEKIEGYIQECKRACEEVNQSRGIAEESMIEPYVAFVDIDEDGTTECILRIMNEKSDDITTSSYINMFSEKTAIYTIRDGEVVTVLEQNPYPIVHLEQVYIYKDRNYIGFEMHACTYFCTVEGTLQMGDAIANGKIGEYAEYTCACVSESNGDPVCTINDKEVSGEQYKSFLADMENNGEGYPMDLYEAD